MFDLPTFLLFMTGALALNVTPGADVAFVLAQSTARGTRAGILAALGIGTGGLVHMSLAALGLTALFSAVPLAFQIVKLLGAAYLVWIAIGMIRHTHGSLSPSPSTVAATFRQGLVTNLFNPKVALFFIAFLPQFVVHGPVADSVQILLLGLAFNLSGTLINCLYALGGGHLADKIRRMPRLGTWMARISASIMIGLAIRLAWPSTR